MTEIHDAKFVSTYTPPEILLQKKYDWESSSDVYRDVSEAVDDIIKKHSGEWPGTLKVTITYEK